MKRQVYIRIWQGQKHEHVDDSKYKMLFKEFDIVDDTLIESFDDMHFLMDTDEEMYRQNVAIKSSVDRFALASILLLICVGAWQVWFLGYYFKSRKII